MATINGLDGDWITTSLYSNLEFLMLFSKVFSSGIPYFRWFFLSKASSPFAIDCRRVSYRSIFLMGCILFIFLHIHIKVILRSDRECIGEGSNMLHLPLFQVSMCATILWGASFYFGPQLRVKFSPNWGPSFGVSTRGLPCSFCLSSCGCP
jgi:hypothetical protein